MENLIQKKGSVESLQQLIAYSKNQTGIASSLSAKDQKHSKEMLSQSGSNTRLQQQVASSHNQMMNFNSNYHQNNINLIHQQQNQQFPQNNYHEDDGIQQFNQNAIPQTNLQSTQFMATSCVNNNKSNMKNHPMQQTSHSSTLIGQSQVVGRKKSQGLLQNINNQNLNVINENNNLLHNSKHNEKNILMDVLSSNQQHHQQLLQRTNQKLQHNLNNESNQQSPLECTSGSKNRNESSGHDGAKVQNVKLNNLINQLTKQSQFNSQFQDGGSPSKIFENVPSSNNKQTKKSKQQQQQIGVNSKEKQKNTMHSYSNSLTNQKNKSSSCSSQQHLLQAQQLQPNTTINPQSPAVLVVQKQENPDIQYQNQQQMYGQDWNIGSQQSSVGANLGYNLQQMGYLQNHLQSQQPYITDQIHKILCGKSLASSSIQQHSSPQMIQQNQQYQQQNMKQNDYYEVNPKIEKDKSNAKLSRNGYSTQQNQVNSPQSQTNATANTLLQNSNHTSSINFASSNGNHLSNTSSTASNHLIYNSPQSNMGGKQNSQNTSQNMKKEEKNKTKKQLTINTAEVHQTYDFPSNLQMPHTTNTGTNKNQLYASNDENKMQNQYHSSKQNINNGLYNQYLQQSQVQPDHFSTKNNVNVQSQQLYLQSAQISQLLSQQQLLNQQQQSHQQSQSQQSNLHQSSNLSSCNRPKTAKNSASSSSNKQNFNLNSSKSKQQQNVASSSSSSIMKQLSPKYQQQLIKYEGMNHILQYQPDLVMKENILNQIGKQNEINNLHEVNQQEPFFLSPKHPKSQPQSTKNQAKQTHFEFPVQPQQQNQQQVNNYMNQNEQINLSQTQNQQKQQPKKNLQINNLMLQQQQNHQSSTMSHGQSQNSQLLTNKKYSSSRETQDLKSNSNLKQSSTRDSSIQKLQRTDLIKIVQRTSSILNSYSKQKEFWIQEKKMLLNEVNQLRTRLQFYEDNTNLQ